MALHLMRSHSFTVREAMGWLRITRPRSIAGEQQHYLCAIEAARKARKARPGPPLSNRRVAAAGASAGQDRPAALNDEEARGAPPAPAGSDPA